MKNQRLITIKGAQNRMHRYGQAYVSFYSRNSVSKMVLSILCPSEYPQLDVSRETKTRATHVAVSGWITKKNTGFLAPTPCK